MIVAFFKQFAQKALATELVWHYNFFCLYYSNLCEMKPDIHGFQKEIGVEVYDVE